MIEQVGLDNSAFSIEFFCEPESGDVRLLEINSRHSQSHAELFEYVDGVPGSRKELEPAASPGAGRRMATCCAW